MCDTRIHNHVGRKNCTCVTVRHRLKKLLHNGIAAEISLNRNTIYQFRQQSIKYTVEFNRMPQAGCWFAS